MIHSRLYPIIRPFLFQIDPEKAHDLTLSFLQKIQSSSVGKRFIEQKVKKKPCEVFGISFANPIGLAAGLDKNADYLDIWQSLGFGFAEIGTVTPQPQAGNPKPRLFRIPDAQALINRMGFNSKGVDYVLENLKSYQGEMPVGVNIGKNKSTSLEKSLDDYLYVLKRVFLYADYICINISSPNTPDLRTLQFGEYLIHLLNGIKKEQEHLCQIHKKYVPILVKISPDLNDTEVDSIADTMLSTKMDGLIATNTTTGRKLIKHQTYAQEVGGLSGRPLNYGSTQTIQQFSRKFQGRMPIIGVGGIDSVVSAQEKIQAGASLLQLYTGFVYQGPGLIKKICQYL